MIRGADDGVMNLHTHQTESSLKMSEASSGSETVESSEAPSIYFGLRHGQKHCASCNTKTYFYFYSYMYNGKVYGWRRCGKCMQQVERQTVRALYDILPRIYRLEYFKRREY